jgi:sugar (pentulose or hexulose) kinase
MEIFSDVFGITASRNTTEGGASLGAAICAAVGAGIYPDIETAAERMTEGQSRESFAPDLANAALYARINETVTATIRDATDPVLERAYPIFH